MLFSKMHGLGNDFIIINNSDETLELSKDRVRFLCDRKYGIGADGLMLVNPSKKADIKMSYYNADGNQVEMCGNGIRCFAKYVYDQHIVDTLVIQVETLSGIKETKIISIEGEQTNVKVNMGSPVYTAKEIPITINKDIIVDEQIIYKDRTITFSSLSMGNPHVVILVENIDSYPIKEIGPFIENHLLFPEKTNVNFCEITNRSKVKVVTWERGVGLTLACGTGTCAAVDIMYKKGLVDTKVDAQLPGGILSIEIDDVIYMTGEAVLVYNGEIDI